MHADYLKRTVWRSAGKRFLTNEYTSRWQTTSTPVEGLHCSAVARLAIFATAPTHSRANGVVVSEAEVSVFDTNEMK